MFRSDRRLWLPAAVVAAATVLATPVLIGESPAQNLLQGSEPNTGQAAAQNATQSPVPSPKQTQDRTGTQAPAESLPQIPAAVLTSMPGQAVATTTPPKPVTAVSPATAEDVGDSMMEQQRYQAAIEAYKKAPRSPDVWNKEGIAYQLMFNSIDATHCYEASLKMNAKNGIHPSLSFTDFPGGLHDAGHPGSSFSFDNELPRHRVWLEPYSLANRLVTCAEFAAFIADGGYHRPELWLSAGWDAVQANGWRAPLYWNKAGDASDADWTIFTLRGDLPLAAIANAPVSQVSYFEADAYARWSGHRLPTEFEWEAAAEAQPVAGNLIESGEFRPIPSSNRIGQYWGDCWQWTASAYLAYPGFKPLPGSLGEYNGKFMSGQMVLRGGSCVTPAAHIRSSYRNFFSPETRWQFSGIRLAT